MAAAPVAWPLRAGAAGPAAPAVPLDIDRLYREQFPRLVALTTGWLGDRDAAEDVAQEALIRLYRALAAGSPVARPGAWLTRVARNLAVSRLRAQARQVSLADGREPSARSAVRDSVGLLADPSDLIEQRERLDEVLVALLRLRPQDRDDLLLGLRAPDQATAAACRGLSGAAWAARLARAREALRLALAPPPTGTLPGAPVAERRRAVAALLARGYRPAAIARELGLPRRTVIVDVLVLRLAPAPPPATAEPRPGPSPAVVLLRQLLLFGDTPSAAGSHRRPPRPAPAGRRVGVPGRQSASGHGRRPPVPPEQLGLPL